MQLVRAPIFMWSPALQLSSIIAISAAYAGSSAATPIVVKQSSESVSPPLLEAFVSYAIEFSSFPDFAGNSSVGPNLFSNNLLNNIGNLTGTKPYIRVGGNTQDYAIYNASLSVAEVGIIDPAKSTNYPTTLEIGPSFFESYLTLPDTKFIHGFNLAKNGTSGRENLLATVSPACKALQSGNLLYWELGNEPDLYKVSAQGVVRPPDWDEADYVAEWLNGTRAIREAMAEACPDLVTDELYKYVAPSFAGTKTPLDPVIPWVEGLDTEQNIAEICSHNYIGDASQPGLTLQGTLMNHTITAASVESHANISRLLTNYSLPFILGEHNSLSGAGLSGISDVFGAALWTLDFNLLCAANNIQRVHIQQGTNFRYSSWQPIDTDQAVKATRPPYYGDIAVAAALGDLTAGSVRVANLPLTRETEAAYAVYAESALRSIVVINMDSYNYTGAAQGSARPMVEYMFSVPRSCAGTALVQRLMANGSDATTGVTFNGVSYEYELDEGRPVVLDSVTRNKALQVRGDGLFSVTVPDASAAVVQLSC